MTHTDTPPQAFLGNFTAFLRLVVRRFGADGGMRIAASLSYTSLLALVPLGTIAFAILKTFPVFGDVQARIQSLVFEAFLPETISNVQDYFTGFVSNAGGLTTIGIAALAVVAIMLLATIETALNDIFRVKAKRAFIPRMMMFWAVLTMGPLLLGGSISMTTYLFALSKTVGVDQLTGFGWLMTRLMPTVLVMFAFSVFYGIVPFRPVRVLHALVGGIVAGLLFALLRKGFALYIASFPAYQTLYGALSTVPIFLIWMFLSWAVVLIGAEITAVLPEWGHAGRAKGTRTLSPTQRLEAALSVLEILWGKSRGEAKEGLIQDEGDIESDLMAETLDALRGVGYVTPSEEGQWFLVRDLSVTTLGGLAQDLQLAPSPAEVGAKPETLEGAAEPEGAEPTEPIEPDHAWQPRLKAALETASPMDIRLDHLFGGGAG